MNINNFNNDLVCYRIKTMSNFHHLWKNLFFYVYLFWEAGEGQKESKADCTASVHPDARLEPTNCEIMAWAKIKSQVLNRLNHPGAPILFLMFVFLFVCLFEREGESIGACRRCRDREPRAGSAMTAESLMRGSNSQTVSSWAKVGCFNPPSHPGDPIC